MTAIFSKYLANLGNGKTQAHGCCVTNKQGSNSMWECSTTLAAHFKLLEYRHLQTAL